MLLRMVRCSFLVLLVLVALNACFSLNLNPRLKITPNLLEGVVETYQQHNVLKTRGGANMDHLGTWGRRTPELGHVMLETIETFFQVLVAPRYVLGFFYGLALLFYGGSFPKQTHLITLMQVTGYRRLRKAAASIKEVYVNARRTLKEELPTVLQAKKALEDYQRYLKETSDAIKSAKEDGFMSKREVNQIEKMKRKQSKKLEKDIVQLERASSSLKTIIEAISIEDVTEIVESLVYWVGIVVACGNQDSWIAILLGLGCYSFNICNMLTAVTSRMNYPLISKLSFSRASISKFISKIVLTALGFFLMFGLPSIGYKINSTLIGATLIVLSLQKILGSATNPFCQRMNGILGGPTGGSITLVLVAVGLVSRYYYESMPESSLSSFVTNFIFTPLHWIDALVDGVVQIAEDLE